MKLVEAPVVVLVMVLTIPPTDGAPRPAGHVAIGVIAVGGVGHPVDGARNARRGVWTDAACAAGVVCVVGGCRAGTGRDIRFAGDVADGVIEVAVAVNDRAAGNRSRNQAVEGVVGVRFGQPALLSLRARTLPSRS
ncbi:MAG: hypothetical protein WDM70_07550 [Nitrosomonadales bacterium]